MLSTVLSTTNLELYLQRSVISNKNIDGGIHLYQVVKTILYIKQLKPYFMPRRIDSKIDILFVNIQQIKVKY